MICAICGREFESRHNSKYCFIHTEEEKAAYRRTLVTREQKDAYNETARRKRALEREERERLKHPEVKPRPKKSIAQVMREAAEHGMSYGRWVALGN